MIPTSWAHAPLLVTMALLLLQDRKAPVPDIPAQKEAEKLVRDVFKEDYAQKTPAARMALAKKLVQQGLETKGDPTSCFVLFREARDLATAAGDAAVALQAIAEIANRYEVNPVEMKGAALASIAKSTRTAEEFTALAKAYLDLVNEAVNADDYESAEAAASAGGQAARKAKDLPLISKLDSRSKEFADLKGRTAQARKAKEALAKNPEDSAAHGVLGHYLCIVRGDWDTGLAHLVKGNDPAFKSAAEKDLGKPSEAADQVALGDAWWDLAERATGDPRARLRSRAAFWYTQARDRLSGLTLVRIEKRIETAGSPSSGREAIDLLKLVDPKKDAVAGDWVFEGTTLVCARELPAARLQIPYLPPEEYDIVLVAERKTGVEAVNFGLSQGSAQFHVVIDGFAKDGYMSGLSEIDGKLAWMNETTRKGGLLTNNRPSTIECSVRKTGVKMVVDGATIFDWSGDFKRLTNFSMLKVPNPKAIYVSGWESKYRFSKMILTPVTGKGEKLR